MSLLLILIRVGPDWIKTINQNTRLSLCLNLLRGYSEAFKKALTTHSANHSMLTITPEFLVQEKLISRSHFNRMKEEGFTFQNVHPDLPSTTPIACFMHEGWEVILLKNGEILKVPTENN
jgi:hypothetical protein